MERDFFAILGLAPGRYDPGEIQRRFHARRQDLLRALHHPATYADARRQLDQLHLAYATLRQAGSQAEYRRARAADRPETARLRQLIAAALEDRLLRYSRRQELLATGRRLGFSDFQTQLLIAQVQFGDDQIPLGSDPTSRHGRPEHPRAWARLAAAGVLALALFLALVRWLGV